MATTGGGTTASPGDSVRSGGASSQTPTSSTMYKYERFKPFASAKESVKKGKLGKHGSSVSHASHSTKSSYTVGQTIVHERNHSQDILSLRLGCRPGLSRICIAQIRDITLQRRLGQAASSGVSGSRHDGSAFFRPFDPAHRRYKLWRFVTICAACIVTVLTPVRCGSVLLSTIHRTLSYLYSVELTLSPPLVSAGLPSWKSRRTPRRCTFSNSLSAVHIQSTSVRTVSQLPCA